MRRKLLLLFVVGLATCVGGSAADTPHIVAKFELLNQTGPIPTTTVFTPKHWGTFQISTIIVQTVASGNGFWNEAFTWTDGGGTQTVVLNSSGNTDLRGSTSKVFALRMNRGKPLRVGTSTVDLPGGQYNLWVVVEQLM